MGFTSTRVASRQPGVPTRSRSGSRRGGAELIRTPALTEIIFDMPGSAKGDAGGSAVTSTMPNAATRVIPATPPPTWLAVVSSIMRSLMRAAGVLAEQEQGREGCRDDEALDGHDPDRGAEEECGHGQQCGDHPDGYDGTECAAAATGCRYECSQSDEPERGDAEADGKGRRVSGSDRADQCDVDQCEYREDRGDGTGERRGAGDRLVCGHGMSFTVDGSWMAGSPTTDVEGVGPTSSVFSLGGPSTPQLSRHGAGKVSPRARKFPAG